jgi:rhomboid protease GluP
VSSNAVTAEVKLEREPSELVEAGVYRTAREGFDHGLVVLAQGQPYWLVLGIDGYRLLVEPPAFEALRDQLARYDRESLRWPPPPISELSRANQVELFTPVLWVLVVLAAFWAQGAWSSATDTFALDTAAVFDRGEVWRPFTALFLHADSGHLVSNVLAGLFIFSAVLSTIGRARGWLLLAISSTVGNLTAAALNYPGPYRSLGASTAIFAGLGLLTGRQIRVAAKADRPHRWRAMFIPFAAGLTGLGLYGAGEFRVDVIAHATGFIAGLALGLSAVAAGEKGK